MKNFSEFMNEGKRGSAAPNIYKDIVESNLSKLKPLINQIHTILDEEVDKHDESTSNTTKDDLKKGMLDYIRDYYL